MGLETLFKEAFKCFNSKNGNCSISFKDPQLSDICFYFPLHLNFYEFH